MFLTLNDVPCTNKLSTEYIEYKITTKHIGNITCNTRIITNKLAIEEEIVYTY